MMDSSSRLTTSSRLASLLSLPSVVDVLPSPSPSTSDPSSRPRRRNLGRLSARDQVIRPVTAASSTAIGFLDSGSTRARKMRTTDVDSNNLGGSQLSPRSLSPQPALPLDDDPLSRDPHSRSTSAMGDQDSTSGARPSEAGPAPSAKPKKVGRPSNAFILYRSEQLRIFKLNGTKKQTQSELSKIIGVMWKAASKTEKEIWEGQAQVVRQKHSLENPEYRTKRTAVKPRSVSSRIVDTPAPPATRRSAPLVVSSAGKPSQPKPKVAPLYNASAASKSLVPSRPSVVSPPLCHPVPCRYSVPLSLDWQHPFSPPSVTLPPPRCLSIPSGSSYTPPRSHSPHQPAYYALRPSSPYPSPLSVSYGIDKIDQFPFPSAGAPLSHLVSCAPTPYDFYPHYPLAHVDYPIHHQPQHLAQDPYASPWALPTPEVEAAPRDAWSSHLAYESGERQMREQGRAHSQWLMPMATTAELMDSVGEREREREMGLGLDIAMVPFM